MRVGVARARSFYINGADLSINFSLLDYPEFSW